WILFCNKHWKNKLFVDHNIRFSDMPIPPLAAFESPENLVSHLYPLVCSFKKERRGQRSLALFTLSTMFGCYQRFLFEDFIDQAKENYTDSLVPVKSMIGNY